MARILLLLFIAFMVYLLLRGLFRSQLKDKDKPSTPATSAKGEDMVACSLCGVNLPRSETRIDGGRLVCLNNPNCR